MKQYTFEVKGMMCGMCESHINDVVRSNADVKKVASSKKKNETVVIAESLDVEKIKSAIRSTGYEVGEEVKIEEYEKKGLFGRKKA